VANDADKQLEISLIVQLKELKKGFENAIKEVDKFTGAVAAKSGDAGALGGMKAGIIGMVGTVVATGVRILATAGTIIGSAISIITGGITAIAQVVGTVVNIVGSVVKAVWTAVTWLLTKIWEAVKWLVTQIWNLVKWFAGVIYDSIKWIAGFAVKALLAIGGAAAAAGVALVALALKVGIAGDEIDDLAKRTGLSVKFLSEMRMALQLNDAQLGDVQTAIRGLSNAMADAEMGLQTAIDAFNALGVSLRDQNGQLKSAEQMFMEVTEAISKVENPLIRNGLAADVFGRSAMALLPLIVGMKTGLADARKEAEKFGLTWTPQETARASDFIDAWDRMKMVLKGLAETLGKPLFTPLTRLFNYVAGQLADNKARVAALGATIGRWLTVTIPKLVYRIRDIAAVVAEVAKIIWGVVSPLIRKIEKWVADFFDKITFRIRGLLKGLGLAMPEAPAAKPAAPVDLAARARRERWSIKQYDEARRAAWEEKDRQQKLERAIREEAMRLGRGRAPLGREEALRQAREKLTGAYVSPKATPGQAAAELGAEAFGRKIRQLIDDVVGYAKDAYAWVRDTVWPFFADIVWPWVEDKYQKLKTIWEWIDAHIIGKIGVFVDKVKELQTAGENIFAAIFLAGKEIYGPEIDLLINYLKAAWAVAWKWMHEVALPYLEDIGRKLGTAIWEGMKSGAWAGTREMGMKLPRAAAGVGEKAFPQEKPTGWNPFIWLFALEEARKGLQVPPVSPLGTPKPSGPRPPAPPAPPPPAEVSVTNNNEVRIEIAGVLDDAMVKKIVTAVRRHMLLNGETGGVA